MNATNGSLGDIDIDVFVVPFTGFFKLSSTYNLDKDVSLTHFSLQKIASTWFFAFLHRAVLLSEKHNFSPNIHEKINQRT